MENKQEQIGKIETASNQSRAKVEKTAVEKAINAILEYDRAYEAALLAGKKLNKKVSHLLHDNFNSACFILDRQVRKCGYGDFFESYEIIQISTRRSNTPLLTAIKIFDALGIEVSE